MHFILAAALISLTSTVTASVEIQSSSLFARSGLDKRQGFCTVEQITPASCAQCFGAGSVNCLSDTCYNPSKGDSCCSDGTYCPAGYYCTDAGCCPNGTPLDQCGATVSLSVVPPPATGTTAVSSASSTLSVQIESTATAIVSTATSAPTTPTSASVPAASTTSSYIPVATFTGAATLNTVIGEKGLMYAVLMLVGNLV